FLFTEMFSGGGDFRQIATELIALEDGFGLNEDFIGVGAAAKIATGSTVSWEWDYVYGGAAFQLNFVPAEGGDDPEDQPGAGSGRTWSVGSGAVGTRHVIMAAGAGIVLSVAAG